MYMYVCMCVGICACICIYGTKKQSRCRCACTHVCLNVSVPLFRRVNHYAGTRLAEPSGPQDKQGNKKLNDRLQHTEPKSGPSRSSRSSEADRDAAEVTEELRQARLNAAKKSG